MCQCNCGSDRMDYWMPGPDGTIYGIQIDPGCHNCQSHGVLVGVRIFEISQSDEPAFIGDDTRRINFGPDEWGKFLPVVSADAIKTNLKQFTEDQIDEYADPDTPGFGMENLIEDAMDGRMLSDAVVSTFYKTKKES